MKPSSSADFSHYWWATAAVADLYNKKEAEKEGGCLVPVAQVPLAQKPQPVHPQMVRLLQGLDHLAAGQPAEVEDMARQLVEHGTQSGQLITLAQATWAATQVCAQPSVGGSGSLVPVRGDFLRFPQLKRTPAEQKVVWRTRFNPLRWIPFTASSVVSGWLVCHTFVPLINNQELAGSLNGFLAIVLNSFSISLAFVLFLYAMWGFREPAYEARQKEAYCAQLAPLSARELNFIRSLLTTRADGERIKDVAKLLPLVNEALIRKGVEV